MPSAATRRLATVLGVALALRLAVPLSAWIASRDAAVFLAPDSAMYLTLAESIARTGRFDGPAGPELLRPPGFPLLVSAGVALGHPVFVTLVLHALLGTLTVWLTYRIALEIRASAAAAIMAAVVVAVDVGQLVLSARMLAETLMTTLVCLGIYGLVRASREPAALWCVLAAAGLAGAAYARVAAYLLPIWMTGALLLACRRRGGMRVPRIVLVAALSAVLIGAWHARNYLVAGYAGFSVHLERALYLRSGTAVAIRAANVGYQDARQTLLDRAGQQGDWTGDADLARRMRSGALATLRQSALPSIWLQLRGSLVTLFAPGTTETLALYRLERPPAGVGVALASGSATAIVDRLRQVPRRTLAVSVVLAVPLFVLLGAAAMGVPASVRSAPGIVVLAAALYFIAVGGGPEAVSRFRAPATPFLAVLAGGSLARAWARLRRTPDGVGTRSVPLQ